ncbi:putative membrane protein [Rhizocola hellebori]|uniref:Putative membrane protein n=1 Tax=Rhizocola hellebori TaxID=1392758 RepID=A0A8J3QJ37_9ACTN|nr:leucine efflux protein LeuE [Rhizocola hellebori]GIH10937.1 putative membrane protein [Rhizocola hellebori]
MFGVTDIWTYVIGTVAIILLPGPNSLFVLSTAAQRGVKAGYQAAFGVFLGDSILMLASAAGVASVLRAYPPLFYFIKYAGAAYLGYLGLKMILGAFRRREPAKLEEPAPAETKSPFRRAFTISAFMNPKATLFFISFFVQFVDPGYAYPALSFLVLAVIVQIMSALYLTALIFGGSHLAEAFRRRRLLAKAGTATVGAVFIGFGLKLATATL